MSEWILRQIGPSLAPLITERLRSAVEKQGVTPMVTHPTYVAALCVLAANNGSAVPALTHLVGGPDESAEHLLGRAVIATRQQFPGCSIIDFNVAAVDMPGPVTDELATGLDASRPNLTNTLPEWPASALHSRPFSTDTRRTTADGLDSPRILETRRER